jgi:hypothetical protein
MARSSPGSLTSWLAGGAIAGASGVQQALQMLHGVLRMLFEQPELRPYFYEGKECPGVALERWRVLTVAEMLGDALEVGLHTSNSIESTNAFSDWMDYSDFLLRNSPALRDTVAAHPGWYSELERFAIYRPGVTTSSDSSGETSPVS